MRECPTSSFHKIPSLPAVPCIVKPAEAAAASGDTKPITSRLFYPRSSRRRVLYDIITSRETIATVQQNPPDFLFCNASKSLFKGSSFYPATGSVHRSPSGMAVNRSRKSPISPTQFVSVLLFSAVGILNCLRCIICSVVPRLAPWSAWVSEGERGYVSYEISWPNFHPKPSNTQAL